MKHRQHYLVKYVCIWIALLLLVFLNACSDGSKGNDGGISAPANIVKELLADPGEGNLAGRVVGTVYGAPLAGVTVSVNSFSTVTADDGTFFLQGIGEGHLAITLSGDNIYTRVKCLNTGVDGRSVSLDAIENFSDFNLKFYREIARGNHPRERDLLPTHRWTNPNPPTFYINTNGEATVDGTVDPQTIEATRRVLRQIAPVFTGGFYRSIQIETRYFPRDISIEQIPDNSFLISFDDSLKLSGAYGLTYTDPDILSSSTSSINKALIFVLDNEDYYKAGNASLIAFEEIIAHEAGHGFGFRHTTGASRGGLPSVMVKIGEFGGVYSAEDQTHMKIVYSRPAGSTDCDNDPLSGNRSRSINIASRVFIDRRTERPRSGRESRGLNRLQGFDIVKELLSQEHTK